MIDGSSRLDGILTLKASKASLRSAPAMSDRFLDLESVWPPVRVVRGLAPAAEEGTSFLADDVLVFPR